MILFSQRNRNAETPCNDSEINCCEVVINSYYIVRDRLILINSMNFISKIFILTSDYLNINT